MDTYSAAPSSVQYTFDPSLTRFNVPYKTYVADHGKTAPVAFQYIAVGALVFNPGGKVLIVQRAATDFHPNRWEIPGGMVDEEDPSIIHAVTRELFEESGLRAKHVSQLIDRGDYMFPISGCRMVYKFNFIVDAHSPAEGHDSTLTLTDVVLDPAEHQNFLWATEQEVCDLRVGEMEITMTSAQQQTLILDAFEFLRKRREAQLDKDDA